MEGKDEGKGEAVTLLQSDYQTPMKVKGSEGRKNQGGTETLASHHALNDHLRASASTQEGASQTEGGGGEREKMTFML